MDVSFKNKLLQLARIITRVGIFTKKYENAGG
jgi:hypothetical protein